MKRYALFLIATLGFTTVLAAPTPAESLKSTLREATQANAEPEVPDPEVVYRIGLRALDTKTWLLHFDIDDCCYLYRDKTRIELVAANGTPAPASASLGSYTLPSGKTKTDEFIGKTEVYYGAVDIEIPVDATADLALKVSYQGCAEKGIQICYPPMTKILPLGGTDAGPTPGPGATFLLALAAAFGAGLLLSFTPCVLPMIPILSGVIIGTEGTQLTKLRGGLLSYAYVSGTAVTYAIAGAVAGATGAQLQAYFQNAWAIGGFSTILVLLALSMFGFYELQLPASVQSLLHLHSSRLRRDAQQWLAGEFIGVFVLGLISALIIGACVSPVLGFMLGTAIAAHDAWLGAGIMFALAHGQGVVLIAVGVSEALILPKAGPWMNSVKHVFGVLLIAVAIYLLGFVPQVPVLLLWGVLFIVCAVYLGATQRLPEYSGSWRYLWKGIGTVLLIWGVLALLGGFVGNRNIFRPLPLSLFGARPTAPAADSIFERVKTLQQLETRLTAAKHAGKPVLLDYYADWCTDCTRMEQTTFADTEIRAALGRFVLVQADVTEAGADSIALKGRFGVYGPPATLFFTSSGDELKELRAYGFLNKDALLALLQRVK